MPNQKLTELTQLTVLTPDDLVYVVNDPSGTPVSRKAEVSLLLGGTSGGYGSNIIKNSPGQIVVDNTIPQWWLETGNATSTLEDAAGEGIPDITEWVLKVVTISDDHHCYQTHTFADESLLDAGQTVVSFGCWVYATSAIARIAISGTNLGQVDSSTHTGDSTWQWLTVNNVTLDAADTAIHTRCIVNTGTAYFTMPSLTVGPIARPWSGRDVIYVPRQFVTQLNLANTGDVAWSDTDCTANTDPLALMVSLQAFVKEDDGTASSNVQIGHSDNLAADGEVTRATVYLVDGTTWHPMYGLASCDDSQVIRYTVNEIDADSDMDVLLYINGYWRWE